VKKCSACAKDLPDTAMHCVFCGAKQAPQPAQANPQAKTVMGYAAADLLKHMGSPGAAPAQQQPAPQAAPPPAAARPPQGFPPPQQPQGFPPPQQPPGGSGGFAPPQSGPPQGFPPAQQPQGFPPPQGMPPAAQGGQFGGSASTAATMFMQSAPQIPQQPAAGPPPQQQPQGFPPPQQPGGSGGFGPPPGGPPPGQGFGPPPGQQGFGPPPGGPPPGQGFGPPPGQQGFGPPPGQQGFGPPPGQQGFGPPPGQQGFGPPPGQQGFGPPPGQQGYPPPGQQGYGPPPGGPGMAGYNPMPAGQQPPFLASQTAARMGRPTEPYNDIMKLVLIGFGAALLAYFVVPASTSPMGFQWDLIIHGGGKMIMLPLFIVAAGILGLVFGLMPLAPVARGGLAALLGLVPLVLLATVVSSFNWQALALLVGGVLLVGGLLLRHEYTSDPLPRIFTIVGAVAVMLPYIVPHFVLGDVFEALFKSFGHPGDLLKVLQVAGPVILAVIAIVVAVIPGPATGGAKGVAWAYLLWPALLFYGMLIDVGHIGDVIKASPGPALLGWVPATSYMAFAGYGFAVLFGKQLEMSR
jgi:hypothetical protein